MYGILPNWQSKMIICFILMFCSASWSTARTLPMTICVANENEAECSHSNAAVTTHDLSEIPHLAQDCDVLHVYLTTGTHYLNSTLSILPSRRRTVLVNLEFHGVSREYPSNILCSNAGISFETTQLTISKVVFDKCGSLQKTSRRGIPSEFIALTLTTQSSNLENVAVMNTNGLGLHAYNGNVTLINCRFLHNTKGHVSINYLRQRAYTNVLVRISESVFYNGSNNDSSKMTGSGGLSVYTPNENVHLNVSLSKCEFTANEGHTVIKVTNKNNVTVTFTDCTFSEGRGAIDTYGVSLQGKNKTGNNITAVLRRCNFTNNRIGGLSIIQLHSVKVQNSLFYNNTGTGMHVSKRSYDKGKTREMVTVISSTHFHYNSRALHLNMSLSNNKTRQTTLITSCCFTHHNLSSSASNFSRPSTVYIEGNRYYTGKNVFKQGYQGNRIHINGSTFERNSYVSDNCSTLLVSNMDNVFLTNLSFNKNKCTGITLVASNIAVHRSLNLTWNSALSGGGIRLESSPVIVRGEVKQRLKFSTIMLNKNSQLNIINNTADRYGGGIFTDNTCDSRRCFFQLETPKTPWKALRFVGNWAGIGGDAVFGGCLSNCSLSSKTEGLVNVTEQNDRVWESISSERPLSRSTFTNKPVRVAFCTPIDSFEKVSNSSACSTSRAMDAYVGQSFNVSLMVVDDFCSPSTALIRAKLQLSVNTSVAHMEEQQLYKKSTKCCRNYTYSIASQQARLAVTIELTPATDLHINYAPALLTVHLQGCPIGWANERRVCACSVVLEKYGIRCLTASYSLEIPESTWVGKVAGNRSAVTRYCTYNCRRGGIIVIRDITKESDELCIRKHTGVLCGACTPNHSLQLGGYVCKICSGSAYRGVMIVLGFAVIGVVLVLLLLSLNLTVSTGLINGLIFYSNIVHLNTEIFLPTDRESSKSHLNNVVKFLSTSLAWINLDFGILTCFFNGYDTYISTWMQFVFPLYIWLLILIIVLASRHSKRISKITTSNTVSVLATLLLLSYAKLLTTSIEAASFTDAEFLHDSSRYRVWILDGNIAYLQGKHIPLFLMSLLTTVVYILPFTLLILLGPLLQARSQYRFFAWINKLKPFLDAFYGPYTSRYRYWPGLLLLARMVILCAFTFYSLGDSPFKLVIVSVMAALLLVVWMLLGRTQSISLHLKKWLNYLELFFILNLAIFAVVTIYHIQVTKNQRKQQGLAVAMVGSALIASYGILVYQIFSIVVRYRVVSKSIQLIPGMTRRPSSLHSVSEEKEPESISASPSHSSVEMTYCTTASNKLREPLLTT